MFANIKDERIYFDIAGPGLVPAGKVMQELPVLVALHGSYLDHSYLKPFLNQLAEKFQIIYPDFRGSGRSSRNNPDSWHIEQLAEDVLGLADLLGLEQIALFGHSWGCHVASKINHLSPARISSNVLCNPAFFQLSEYLTLVLDKAGAQAVHYARKIFQDKDPSNFSEYMSEVAPLLFELDPPPEIFTRTIPSIEFFLSSIDELNNIDLAALMSEIQAPSLLITGALDPYAGNKSAASCAGLGNKLNIEIANFKNSAHFVFLDEADAALHHISKFFAKNKVAGKCKLQI